MVLTYMHKYDEIMKSQRSLCKDSEYFYIHISTTGLGPLAIFKSYKPDVMELNTSISASLENSQPSTET